MEWDIIYNGVKYTLDSVTGTNLFYLYESGEPFGPMLFTFVADLDTDEVIHIVVGTGIPLTMVQHSGL